MGLDDNMTQGQYPAQGQYQGQYQTQGQYQSQYPVQGQYQAQYQGQGYNQYQAQQLPRLTKGQVYDFICSCVQGTMNVAVSELVKIDCNSPTIRHICLNAMDIQFLQQTSVGVPYRGVIVQVPVWFCPICGKLYINPDYLDYSNNAF